jgi:putative oxidoreductase
MKPVRGLARTLLGGLFVISGAQAVLAPRKYAALAEPLTDQLAPLLEKVHSRIPTEPERLVQINGAVQLGAGLLLATGKAPRPAAAILAGTLLPATIVNHPFWRVSNDTVRHNEQVQFAKNLGLLGGLLLAAADTAGAPSLRWRAQRALRKAQKSVTASENS